MWRVQMENAAKFGFHIKGITDMGFIEMICDTKKNFKDIDNRLHELKLGRAPSQASIPVARSNPMSVKTSMQRQASVKGPFAQGLLPTLPSGQHIDSTHYSLRMA